MSKAKSKSSSRRNRGTNKHIISLAEKHVLVGPKVIDELKILIRLANGKKSPTVLPPDHSEAA